MSLKEESLMATGQSPFPQVFFTGKKSVKKDSLADTLNKLIIKEKLNKILLI